jgi:two-component system, chemotaxis family, sensor kinase CheA
MDFEKIIEEFRSEALEILDNAENDILSIETTGDLSVINSVFRYIHTLKGNSGMFEFNNIMKLSHSLENLLGKIREKKITINKEITDELLYAIDQLKAVVRNLEHEKDSNVQDTINKIDEFLKHSNSNESIEINSEHIIIDDTVLASNFTITESMIQTVKIENKYLFIAVLEYGGREGYKSLKDLVETFAKLNGSIIEKKFLDFSFNSVDLKNSLLFGLLIKSSDLPISLLKQNSIRYYKLVYLFEPQVSPSLTQNVEQKAKINQTNHSNESVESHLRVRIQLLDDLINLVGETIITRNQLIQRSSLLQDKESSAILSRMSQLITQLHTKIMNTRLQELGTIQPRLNRVVRDLSNGLKKKVELRFDAGGVELDKNMMDVLQESLVHMIRNSLDHGIEDPEERKKNGKHEFGIIRISASLQIGNVQVVIEDDGRGINRDKVRSIAVSKGLIAKEKVDSLSENEIEDLLFLPGFSTASVVTETSGRGVGMDAVRASIQKLGGSVRISSQFGLGTKIKLNIPQSVSVISCLLISVNGVRYALFQKYISELLSFDEEYYTTANNHKMYKIRNELLPLVNLGNVLYPNDVKAETNLPYIAVLKSEKYRFGIQFDQMIGAEEIVVKPLGEYFHGLRLYSGATILGDGQSVLILDVSGLAEFLGINTNEVITTGVPLKLEGFKREEGYILFSVSDSRFACQLDSVLCIERISDYKIESLSGIEVVQYKNDIMPIVHLEEIYNISRIPDSDFFMLIIQIGGKNIAIAIHEIIDIVYEIQILKEDLFHGEGIIGHALVNGHTTIVLNAIELLSKLSKIRFGWVGRHVEEFDQISLPGTQSEKVIN